VYSILAGLFIGALLLRLWIAGVVAGAVLTIIPSAPAPPIGDLSWTTLATAYALGIAAYFAYGVDLPESNRRFARLS
jgi:uncharacterized membrane protein